MTDPLLVKVPDPVKATSSPTNSIVPSFCDPSDAIKLPTPDSTSIVPVLSPLMVQFPVSVSGSNPPIWSTPPIVASTVYVTPKIVLTQVSVPGVPAASEGTGRATWVPNTMPNRRTAAAT